MSNVKIYGIKNCDTMKKAFKWLDENGVDYEFHDYKKMGVQEDVLRAAIEQHGWEVVINKRGTTWRKLSDDVKESMDSLNALEIAAKSPSIIKRPVILANNSYFVGFTPEVREKILI